MPGTLLIGGAYFTDERLGFFDNDDHTRIDVSWEDVGNQKTFEWKHPDDYVWIFGLKKWVRKLKKKRWKQKKIVRKITDYVVKQIPKGVPLGVLDDLNYDDEKLFGEYFMQLFSEKANLKVYLLREYHKKSRWPKWVIPFTICCKDLGEYIKDKKDYFLYFRGDASSHKLREEMIDRWRALDIYASYYTLYKGGENDPEKIPREQYLDEMGRSAASINLPGRGMCCFRYQEIPSVESLLVSYDNKLRVRNDYTHGVNCWKFRKPEKCERLLRNPEKVIDMALEGRQHFLKYHTTEVRYNEFLEFCDEVRRDKKLS